MFYVVPKDRSIISNEATTETLYEAQWLADNLKTETGQNYDIIEMKRVWTTQTLDEAHRASLDIPHMARD